MGLPEDVRVIARMHDHVEVHPMNLNDAFGAMQAYVACLARRWFVTEVWIDVFR